MTGWSTADVAGHYGRMGVSSPVTAACGDGVRRNKYNVAPKPDRTAPDGTVFASKREMRHYQGLQLAARLGQIGELRLQPKYLLQPAFVDAQGVRHRAIYYVGDFEYLRDGRRVCEDVKGRQTAVYAIKRKLFIARYPEIEFREVR